MPATENLDALGIPPSEPSSGTVKFKVLRSDFGDNYSQRARDGLNNKKRVETYVWPKLPNAIAQTLYDFLLARGNDEAFLWTPPDGSGVQRQFTMMGDLGRPYHIGGQVYSVTATFQEEFDL